MKKSKLWISCRCGWTGSDDALVGDAEHPECPRCHTTFTTYPPRAPEALSWRMKSRQPPGDSEESSMTDIVEQLRNFKPDALHVEYTWSILNRAADEIVRLRELMSMESGYEIKIPAKPAEAGEVQ